MSAPNLTSNKIFAYHPYLWENFWEDATNLDIGPRTQTILSIYANSFKTEAIANSAKYG